MSECPGSAPPVLLRIRNNDAEVAYVLFLSLDRTDPSAFPLSGVELPLFPISSISHTRSQSLETTPRPRKLDLSGIRVEETTIEIGTCSISSTEVGHIAYHRGKALALLQDRPWFPHSQNSRRQLYTEHYFSRESVMLMEYHVQAYRQASRGSVGLGRHRASQSVDEQDMEDVEQRTAAIVAAITANLLEQTDIKSEAESETEMASETETGSQTLAGSFHNGMSGGEQTIARSPSMTVREPWAHHMTNELAQAAMQTVELERSYQSANTGSEHQRPRRATTSAKATLQNPASPKPKGSFWKSLRRHLDPTAAARPSPDRPRRASTSAKRTDKSRNQARHLYPEGIWENPRPAPKPPVSSCFNGRWTAVPSSGSEEK